MHYALSLLLFDGVDGALFGLATPHRVRAVVVRGEAALLLPPPHLQSAPAAAAPQEGGAQCGRIAPRRARSLSPLLIRAAPRRPSEYGPQWLVTLYTHYCTARGCGACSAWSRATHTAQSVHPWCTILLGQKKIGTEKRSRRKRKKGSREEEGKVLRAHRRAHTHTHKRHPEAALSLLFSLSLARPPRLKACSGGVVGGGPIAASPSPPVVRPEAASAGHSKRWGGCVSLQNARLS